MPKKKKINIFLSILSYVSTFKCTLTIICLLLLSFFLLLLLKCILKRFFYVRFFPWNDRYFLVTIIWSEYLVNIDCRYFPVKHWKNRSIDTFLFCCTTTCTIPSSWVKITFQLPHKTDISFIYFDFVFYRFGKHIRSMTVFAEANVDVDLRMLRSFRVLRPLKLVSRIPSKGHRHLEYKKKSHSTISHDQQTLLTVLS